MPGMYGTFFDKCFHSVDSLAAQPFQNGDMRHGHGGAAPMLLTPAKAGWHRPANVPRDRFIPAQTAARCPDKRYRASYELMPAMTPEVFPIPDHHMPGSS